MTWSSPSIPHFYKPITAYYPNDPWDVITYDAWGKRIDPIIPEGAVIPWWRQPKDRWPYISPWEPKIFGAFPPFWFKMREDIGAPVTGDDPQPWPSPEIWPTVTFPKPAGLMHVNTRPDRPGPGLGPKVPKHYEGPHAANIVAGSDATSVGVGRRQIPRSDARHVSKTAD
jgi:hypothetical protein